MSRTPTWKSQIPGAKNNSSLRLIEAEVGGSRTCKPNSVCRRSGRTIIPLGHALLRDSSDLPGGLARRASTRSGKPETSSLFGLAPCGVYHARCIAAAAVRSCRTFSPLPRRSHQSSADLTRTHKNGGRYVFCGTFRQPSLNLVSRMLSGTLLCGVRTFLCHP